MAIACRKTGNNMALERVSQNGLVLLGCGKMGSALLAGWLEAGIPAASVWVLEPNPSSWLRGIGVHLNQGLPPSPAVALLAVKPQMMGAALPALQALGNGATLFISIAAGTAIATFEAALGARTPTDPNVPATTQARRVHASAHGTLAAPTARICCPGRKVYGCFEPQLYNPRRLDATPLLPAPEGPVPYVPTVAQPQGAPPNSRLSAPIPTATTTALGARRLGRVVLQPPQGAAEVAA
jgi:hypothetical protein